MFVAWRELRSARGRFALISAVVALITLLVGFLAGLTGGLASQNVSAVLDLPGDRLVLAAPGGDPPAFATSALTPSQVSAWGSARGVTAAVPVGIAQSRAQGADGLTGVALVGLPAGGGSAGSSVVAALAPSDDGAVGLSAGAAAQLGVGVGGSVTVAGSTYRVDAVGGSAWYSHTPVLVMTPAAWAAADQRVGGDGRPTALAVTGSPDWDAVGTATSTKAQTPLASLGALETFRSEVGSLGLMIGMLFVVSALVVGAFFTVWGVQRSGDVAVLKALGATTGSLVRDALGQALVVLLVGTGVGTAAVVVLGSLAGSALPFVLSPLTTAVPSLVLVVLGLAGAAVALRSVTSADPLTALGSLR